MISKCEKTSNFVNFTRRFAKGLCPDTAGESHRWRMSDKNPRSLLWIDRPVGLRETGYSPEVLGVIRDENEIVCDGTGRDDQIEVVQRRAGFLQARFEESEHLDAFGAYRQNIERTLQSSNLGEVTRYLPGFIGAIVKLHQGNGADLQRVIEVRPQIGLDHSMPLETVYDYVRVEKVHSQPFG